MDRFFQLLVQRIFGSRPRGKAADEEFLKIIKDNFFESLSGGQVRLTFIREINWSSPKNIRIAIDGYYSVHKSVFTLVLDKHFKAKNLFVA